MWGVTPSDLWDWNALRGMIEKNGIRNSLLVAPMPTASTSQILGNNECFEPYTSNIYSRRVLRWVIMIPLSFYKGINKGMEWAIPMEWRNQERTEMVHSIGIKKWKKNHLFYLMEWNHLFHSLANFFFTSFHYLAKNEKLLNYPFYFCKL